jgi:hypothetical protein
MSALASAVSRDLGFLARRYICQLQPVLGFERNDFHLPIALCAVGIVRNFPDFGA